MNKFGGYLRKRRKEKGMTQAEVASIFGWTAMYYGRYENGKLVPNKSNIKKFSDFLNISTSKIMELIGDNNNEPEGY